jgi:hypothetical protein
MASSETRTLNIVAKMRDQMTPAMSRAGAAFRKFGAIAWAALRRVWSTLTSLKTLITGVLVGALGRFLVGQTREVAQVTAEYGEWASKLGATVEELDKLAFAASRRGLNFDQVREGLKTLQERLDDASQGTRTYAEHLERLGIDYVDPLTGRLRSAVEIVPELSAAFARFVDEGRLGELVLISEDLIGGSENMLSVLLQEGPEALAAWQDLAEVYGIVTTRQATMAREVRNAFTDLERAADTVKRTFLEMFGAEIIGAARALARALAENRELVAQLIKQIGGLLLKALAAVLQLLVAIAQIIGAIADFLGVDFSLGAEAAVKSVSKLYSEIHEARLEVERLQEAMAGGQDIGGSLAAAKRQLDSLESQLAVQSLISMAYSASEGSSIGIADTIAKIVARTRELFGIERDRARLAVEQPGRGQPTSGALGAPAGDSRPTFDKANVAIGQQLQGIGVQQQLLQAEDQTRSVQLALLDLDRQAAALQIGQTMLPLIQQGVASFQDLEAAIGASDATFAKMAERVQGDSFMRGLSDGATEAMMRWTDFTGAVQSSTSTLLDTAFSGLGDAFTSIIDGSKSAKDAFKDYGAQILKTIAQIIPQLLIVRALKGLFGGFLEDGGITPGVTQTIPTRKFADGGVARRPTFALFGEAGAEAFVPLKHGAIPVTVSGSGAGSIHFAPTINAMDARSVRQLLVDERETIMGIWQREMQRDVNYRQTIKRTR